MLYLGKSIEDDQERKEILSSAEVFIAQLHENISEADISDDFESTSLIPDMDYYLIYNRYVRKGKKIIDKRVPRKIDRSDIIHELDSNWIPGEEPNLILLPSDLSLGFGIYIQDTIFFYRTKLI